MTKFNELILAYGIILGGGTGVVIFGITGDVVYLAISVGIGLVIGAIVGEAYRHPDKGLPNNSK